MGRLLAYTFDGSWTFESVIVPSLRVMTEHGHAKFTDGAFTTKNARLAETLIERFPELPGLGLISRPEPVKEIPASEAAAASAEPDKTFWRRFPGGKAA